MTAELFLVGLAMGAAVLAGWLALFAVLVVSAWLVGLGVGLACSALGWLRSRRAAPEEA